MSQRAYVVPGLVVLLVSGTAGLANASVPSFGRCLRMHGLPTTLRADGSGSGPSERLDLPDAVPARAVIDAALAACREHVHWPRGFGNADLLLRLRARGRRFQACMRKLGLKPGRPVVFLADTGVGLELVGLRGRPPAPCARLLPPR